MVHAPGAGPELGAGFGAVFTGARSIPGSTMSVPGFVDTEGSADDARDQARYAESPARAGYETGFILGARAGTGGAVARRTRMAGALMEDSDEDDAAGRARQAVREVMSAEQEAVLPGAGPSGEYDGLGPPADAPAICTGHSDSSESASPAAPSRESEINSAAHLSGSGRLQEQAAGLTAPRTAVPPVILVDNLESPSNRRPPSASGKSVDLLPLKSKQTFSHGLRALARLGFKPCQRAVKFGGTTRPLTPKHRPHSRVWLESYFSKTPLLFHDHFDVKLLVDRGIHLENEGERPLDFQRAKAGESRCHMYADPMPGQLQRGGLFANGPGSPMKLKLGKERDWSCHDENTSATQIMNASAHHTSWMHPAGHTLCIQGLDPYDPHALRARLSRLCWPHVFPEAMLLYPSQAEGAHYLVAYVRLQTEHALQVTMERCEDLGLKASRASLDDLCKVTVDDDDESEAQVLAELHPSGRPFVTSPPMVASPVFRHEPTQALEQSARKLNMQGAGRSVEANRPESARTRPAQTPPLCAWGSSPPASPTSPFREGTAQRVLSPFQRGPTFKSGAADAPPHPLLYSRLSPASNSRPASARAETSKASVRLERRCMLSKGSAPLPQARVSEAHMQTSARRHGPSGHLVDLLFRPPSFSELYVDKRQAMWGQALYDAPWG